MKINKLILKILILYFSIFSVLFTALYLMRPFSFENFKYIAFFNTIIGFITILVSCFIIFKKSHKKLKTIKDCDTIYYICKRIPIILYFTNMIIPIIVSFIYKDRTSRILSAITFFSATVFYIFSKNYYKDILDYSENNFRVKTMDLINTKNSVRDISLGTNIILKILPLSLLIVLITLSLYPLNVSSIIYIVSLMLINVLSLIYLSTDFNNSIINLSQNVISDYNNSELNELSYSINARINNSNREELSEEHLSTIEMIRRTVDAKDTYTRGHSDRVSKYAILIGRKLGLSDNDLRTLEIGGLFHDIGKIGIPDNILLKENNLSNEEYDEIKKHPLIGAYIIETSTVFSSIVPIIKYHHEKYDGSGYPEGLKGQEIPLMARIISVADTFDAMTSKRSYRDSLPIDVVKNELKRNASKQFDPEIIDTFLDILNNNYNEVEEIMKL